MDKTEFEKAMEHVVRVTDYFVPRERKFYLSILFKETQKVSRELIEKVFLGLGITDPASTLEVDMYNDGSCEAKCANNNEFLHHFNFSKDCQTVPFNCSFLTGIFKGAPYKFIWLLGDNGKKGVFIFVYDLNSEQRQMMFSERNIQTAGSLFGSIQSMSIIHEGGEKFSLSFKSATLTCEGLVVKYEEGE